jgi:hypothetical protein
VLLISLVVFCGVDAKIDPKEVSVSGISSGGYMATQYQFAHSASVKGAGVFAGGPYYCAQNNLNTALLTCMYGTMPLSLPTLENFARNFASSGLIDPLSNLRNHKVYIFSGDKDATVKPTIVRGLETMYYDLGVLEENIESKFDLAAAHTFPTISFGNPCTTASSPFISKCNYDGAGITLEHMYGELKPPVPAPLTNIVAVDQKKYIGSSTLASLSLGPEAYLYVPTGCKNGAGECKLHIAFHGCQQYKNAIGMSYVENTGYNGWGEANNIFILYPQATSSSFAPQNPNGCWDWFGYINKDYANQNGPQIRMVNRMVLDIIATY